MAEKNSDESNKIQSSSSTSYILSLSDELLVEILCRLGSSKYATQCKCICKRWFSLVNSTNSRDSYFLRRWRKIHQEEQPIVLLTQYTLLLREEENDYSSDYTSSENNSAGAGTEEENDYNYHNYPGVYWEDEDYHDDYDFDYIESMNYSGFEYDDYYFDDYSVSTNNSGANSGATHSIAREKYHAIYHLSLFNKDLPTFNPLNFLPCNTSHDDINDRVTSICILATFKDLVLCCPSEKDHSVYYICNPFTRQWIALPPSPLPPGYNFYSVRVGLVVSDDPEYGNDLKFKVVRVLGGDHVGNNDIVKVEIFSSDDSSCMWRVRDISVPAYCYFQEQVASYDGMLVWRSECREHEQIILFPDDNACANTDANYTLLPLPVGYKEWNMSSHIGVCMGCLRIGQLVETNSNLDDYVPKLIIWELNRHSQDWELVHELDFSEVDLPDLPGDEYLEESNILAFHPRDGDILFLDFVSNERSMTCICNVRERTVELIPNIPIKSWRTSEVFPLQMPSWPTTIPLPSLPPELEKSTLTDPDELGSKSALVETSN